MFRPEPLPRILIGVAGVGALADTATVPVLGIYAGKDSFVTPESVKALDAQLTALGKRHEFHTYPSADHAFFNDERKEVYDPAAAADAWTKTLAFFRRELK